jgi:hypothetical protein
MFTSTMGRQIDRALGDTTKRLSERKHRASAPAETLGWRPAGNYGPQCGLVPLGLPETRADEGRMTASMGVESQAAVQAARATDAPESGVFQAGVARGVLALYAVCTATSAALLIGSAPLRWSEVAPALALQVLVGALLSLSMQREREIPFAGLLGIVRAACPETPFSAGLVEPSEDCTVESVIAEADIALYEAKRNGRTATAISSKVDLTRRPRGSEVSEAIR